MAIKIIDAIMGAGKAQTLDSLLLSKEGFIQMKNIKLNMQIYGEDGELHSVVGVYPQGIKDVYEDGDAYIGLMRWKDGEPFEYWIAIFTPEATPVPDSFGYIDFPKSELGVCWIYGKEGDVYCKEDKCAVKLGDEGYKIILDRNDAWWFFERYVCHRFTTPDDKGNIILDICLYIE
jgi:hypothetical protein